MCELLGLGHCKANVYIKTQMMVDSLEMTDTERIYLIQKYQLGPNEQIIIAHGIGSMVKRAYKLPNTIDNQTIVLTGA